MTLTSEASVPINGRIALVTGAGGAIGGAIVRRLRADGISVIGSDIAATGAFDDPDAVVAHDTSAEADWERVLGLVLQRFGRLDILVNNAGIAQPRATAIADTSLDDWRKVMSVNLDGAFLGTKHAMRAMAAAGGSIVNVGSMLSFVVVPDAAAYCSSKAGLLMLTKAAAVEGARFDPPVRVNSVHPGYVATPRLRSRLASSPDWAEQVKERTPLRRLATVEEVAAAVAHLASDEAGFTTGAALRLDGGYTAI